MVEAGFVQLVQAGLQAAGVNVPGGFAVQLTKDLISSAVPKAWAYRSITAEPTYALNAQLGWTEWTVQIDCHGYAMTDAINLARAIETFLRGVHQTTLPDSDHTFVHDLYRLPSQVDGFSDASRTFVRSLEFVVQYEQI